MTTVAFCEIDPFCQQVLRKHWPDVPIHADVRQLNAAEVGPVDVICGGFPCQDISLAGRRAGISGERSGLYREMVRAIRMVRPKHAIMENVAALLGLGMGRILGDVAENGYDAEWDCISASDVGAPHGRDRVWIALTDAHQLKRPHGSGSPDGWWLWRSSEIAEARNAGRVWPLQPPRLLGNIRRWVDNAARGGAWWTRDWKAEFEALRGMDDGAADGLDKSINAAGVKCCGNAVVPQIPEIIGRAIMNSRDSG